MQNATRNMKILTITDIQKMVQAIGLDHFFKRVIAALEEDFGRWDEFLLSPRHATHYPHGVIELMPCADQHLYAFKYVNGHPGNPLLGKLNVVAVGLLSDVASGYPLMISEMTLLTAFRTAATGVLAAKHLARKEAKSVAIIGTGAQSEFQVMAFASFFRLEEVRFFDTDPQAMSKFSRNLSRQKFRLIPCDSITQAVHHADIVITATAAKKRQSLLDIGDIAPGTFIHAMGGDCPGKTELSEEFLNQVKLVVEYMPQTLVEGEVQQCTAMCIYAELWELVCQQKYGRQDNREIILFDCVGFALEDFSILRVVYELAKEHRIGSELPMIPKPNDPKNLFGLLESSRH
ncbi:ornithine cyclodeaminase ArcB [Methyloglobulus morosus KoM1]|uniref:Ornithine cyclodeaminase ArcB n=2 Tax=Methyloglobulus TaxID=1410680 RepID=V5BKH9_9GAMM|nr:ornithine cyclodeaminase ArcB [Methyloglobulus morosus KoM1]